MREVCGAVSGMAMVAGVLYGYDNPEDYEGKSEHYARVQELAKAYEAENGAANYAVYYLQLLEGEFKVIQGVIFDAVANENAPWFMTYDLDWDVSNDIPIDEKTANSVMKAGKNIYAAQEYFPYSLYK